MNKIKIVQKYFNRSEATAAAAYQRKLARKQNLLIANVEVIEAYQLFKTNGWFRNNPFKKLGLPAPEQFMVVVHYEANVCQPTRGNLVKDKIVKAVKEKKVKTSFHIVKLTGAQLERLSKVELNKVMNVSVPAWKFKRVSHTSLFFKKCSFEYVPATNYINYIMPLSA